MKIEHRQVTVVNHSGEVVVERNDIIELLRSKKAIPQDIPDNEIKVEFSVPDGGDHSGMSLEIENNLIVSWSWDDVKD